MDRRCRPGESGWTKRSASLSSALPAWAARQDAGRAPQQASAAARRDRRCAPRRTAARAMSPPSPRGGLAFDGRVKPDLVAPGVALLTAEPGRGDGGAERYASVSGSERLRSRRRGSGGPPRPGPTRSSTRPRSRRCSSARLARSSKTRSPPRRRHARPRSRAERGGRRLADQPELRARGRRKNWQATRKLIVRNLSSRTLRLRIVGGRPADRRRARARLRRRPHRGCRLRRSLGKRLRHGPNRLPGHSSAPTEGLLQIRPEGGATLRVPWLISFRPARRPCSASSR